MKESITDKKLLRVMVGFLVIGSLAAMFGLYRAAKPPESPAYFI